jgi:hypothetical protein
VCPDEAIALRLREVSLGLTEVSFARLGVVGTNGTEQNTRSSIWAKFHANFTGNFERPKFRPRFHALPQFNNVLRYTVLS